MSADFIFTENTKDVVLARLTRFLSNWPADKPCHVIVKRFVKNRTVQQNRALFGLAYKILREETGHTLDELHSHFCEEFFGTVEFEVMGKLHKRPRRTTTTDEHGKRAVLPWDEFSDFYAAVERAAAEVGVYIPPPDPDWWKEDAA